MKNLIFSLAFILSLISFQALAVINNSTYQMTLKTNVNLVTGTKTTIIVQNQSNTVSSIIALPFNFTLDGISYSHFGACSDGWIKLGNSSSMSITANNSNDLTNSNDRPKIAPFWERMNIPNSTGQGVHTITNGVSPNRTFTIEWNVAIPRNGTGRGTFQMVLHETSNQIQFIYSGMNGASFFSTYSIGLSGAGATSSSDFASVSTATNGAHTVSYTSVNNSNSATLVNNSSILFTPRASTLSSSNAFTNIERNSFTATWTKGSGSGRLVVARTSATTAVAPSNHTVYTANTSYGSGTQIGTGNFVVGSGDINTVNLSGLTASTNYCLDIYEYVGSLSAGNAVFNTTAFTACQTTLSSYPTIGPSDAVFSNITANALTLSWTNGNGNNRLVVASKDAAPNTLITDFASYTANASYGQGTAIGNGFVVYNGNGNSFNLSNLTGASTYYFHVYEYNNLSNEFYYAINLRLSCNATTLIPSPTTGASNITFTAIGQNNISLSWTKGNGANRIVLARSSADPDVNPSDLSSYTANSVYGSGTAIGNAYVVYDGNGNSVNVTGLNPATYYHFTVIEYNGTGNNKYYANELKTSSNCSTLQPDADNDGVIDAEDEYPNNAFKAYNTRFPAAGFGTLMFEDLWPGKGDYDFNDLVLDYNYLITSNANNEVVEVKYTFVTRAIGGALHNGFAFQLDGIPSNRILSVTGSKAVGATWAGFNGNGTEAGQTYTNILVLKDAYDLLPVTGGYSFVNVDPQAPFVGTDTTVITIKFADGNTWASEERTAITSFTSAIFNPYLIVGQDRGKEIHLPNRVPTSLVNSSYFGMYQDDSNPAEGRYYKTKNELPWVLNINQSIPYPLEKTDFTDAYLNFYNWANSNGSSNTDWYLNKQNYRDNTKIYSK
ncbi:MAG: LruC domain-containing protein [Bacteroidia bacterium]